MYNVYIIQCNNNIPLGVKYSCDHGVERGRDRRLRKVL